VTGRRREGAFMGVLKFTDKAAVGLAVFLGMQGLEAVGYQPNVPQSETVIRGIKILYCVLPAVCHLGALLALRRFPLTREAHAEIRRQLDARNAEATEPA